MDTLTTTGLTRLRLWGHAAVTVQAAGGETLLVDPFAHGSLGGTLQYPAIDAKHDWVIATHEHADHSAFSAVAGERVGRNADEAGPFRFLRTPVPHDEYGGRRFGGSVDLLEIQVDGYRILHLSDVGASPRSDWIARHRGVDIALAPVGGFYTIGAAQAEEWVRLLGARTAIPIHHATPWCTLPLRKRDLFLARFVEYSAGATSFMGVGEALNSGGILALRPGAASPK